MSCVQVFNRREKKYLLTLADCQVFLDALGQALVLDVDVDGHDGYTVRNLYLDTPDHLLIGRSIQKPYFKEKLRVRSYGSDASVDGWCFLEIKRKLGGQVYKRRTPLTIAQARDFVDRSLAGGALIDGLSEKQAHHCYSCDEQIRRELTWTLGHYRRLVPDISVNYRRCAYRYHNLRITVDRLLRYKRGSWQDFLIKPDCPDFLPLLPEGACVLEVKGEGSMPLKIANLLNSFKIYPQSYSKVGAAYQALAVAQTTSPGGEPKRQAQTTSPGGEPKRQAQTTSPGGEPKRQAQTTSPGNADT
ncbi:MAG: polyphosphate polymerase domain-containing protein [Coriobacteriales bacterium]|nr:polyphosphate polymerase domain-containing protein [Coriobacteriales bacterium]